MKKLSINFGNDNVLNVTSQFKNLIENGKKFPNDY